MKTLIAIAVLAASQIAAADWVYREGKSTLRLTDAPCANAEVLDRLPDYIKPLMLQGTAILQGHAFAPCWVPYKRDFIYLAYPDGDQGMLLKSEFKNEPGI